MLQKINKVRSVAVQFTLANPCCIRVIPYENKDTQSLTVCLYVDTHGNGVPHHVENAAKEMFANCEIKCVDLQRRPLSKIVTRLQSCERKKGKEIFVLSRKIEENLDLFENRLNVTAVCASYKVTEAVEKEIPCVTVFVLGKGKIPAKETDIHKIKEDNGHLFDNAEFDVVEGYYRPAYGSSPEIEYAFPLRGGVGIGVQGVPCAGTLGGFLEDENGECYILSNHHVLSPPKLKNNTLSSDDSPDEEGDDSGTSSGLKEDVNNTEDDGPNGMVDDAGTSAGLKEDVIKTNDDDPNGVVHDAETSAGLKDDVNNPNDNGSNGVVYAAGLLAGLTEDKRRPIRQIIEQPAKKDYVKMRNEAQKDHDNIKAEYSDVANLSQAEKNNFKRISEYCKRRLEQFEMKNSHAQHKLQEIEKGKPRRIGEYVGGLKGNVKMNCNNETHSFYVDAAIAKLDKRELEYITLEKADNKTNHCPLYGFNKVNNVVPTGKVVKLDTFVKEIYPDPNNGREKVTFLKIGKTTGATDDGQIDTTFGTLFVSYPSFPKEEKLLTSAMAHSRLKYCIKCKPSDVGEAGLVKGAEHKCSSCQNKIEKSEVYLSWMHNCFAIRCEKPFSDKGDSGSLIFDNHGRAWGLLYAGWFVCNDHAITLASPLTVALNALGKECGKKLKLW